MITPWWNGMQFDDEGQLSLEWIEPDRTALLLAAVEANAAGLNVIPPKTDGSKAPGLSTWKQFMHQFVPVDDLVGVYSSDTPKTDGIGIVSGAISGNLEMFELEAYALSIGMFEELGQLCHDNGIGDVWDTLVGAYVERSGGDGMHLFYRVDGEAAENVKLAMMPHPTLVDSNGRPKLVTLIETRGEGGYCVLAPSAGRTRGKGAWRVVSGTLADIPTITEEQRDRLHLVASMLDASPQAPDHDPTPRISIAGLTGGIRPGDDFNARATWQEVIGKHGWQLQYTAAGPSPYTAWKKPGKKKAGISATTGQSSDGADRLFVFSTETEFQPRHPYSKFAAYALLEHGMDYAAAAKALAASGYGTKATVRVPAMAGTRSKAPDTVPTTFPPPVPAAHQEPEAPRSFTADTQDAHAIMLIAAQGERIRYCPELDKWLAWDTHLWKPQARDGGIVYEYAKQVARMLPEGTKEEARYKRSCLTSNGIGAALRLAQTDPAVRVHVDSLDADPWGLNTPDGMIDLATGALHPADPEMHHTKTTLVAPDFLASQSQWLAFLAVTFGGNDEVIEWVQRLFGYACIGVVREHVFPVLYGQGANGKSVLLEVVSRLLGDYAITLPPKFLTQNGQGVTDAAGLIGVRLAVASETNEGESFDEALVKRLTGGDTVRARYMRQDWFQFTPSHTLVLATNHRPEVPSGGGNSFWRRVREVPFNHIVAEDDQDAELPAKLISEHGPAIMAWLAQGAAKYARDGLSDPAIVTKATAAYAESADHISQYLDARCTTYVGAREKVADLYRDYTQWCTDEGIATKEFKGRRQFIEATKRHGGESRKGTGGAYFVYGIRLLTDDERDSE